MLIVFNRSMLKNIKNLALGAMQEFKYKAITLNPQLNFCKQQMKQSVWINKKSSIEKIIPSIL